MNWTLRHAPARKDSSFLATAAPAPANGSNKLFYTVPGSSVIEQPVTLASGCDEQDYIIAESVCVQWASPCVVLCLSFFDDHLYTWISEELVC